MASGAKRLRSYELPLCAQPPIPGYSASSSSRQGLNLSTSQTQRSISSTLTKPAETALTKPLSTVVGVGSCFLKMFVGNFGEMMFLPRGYTIEPDDLSKHWFSFTAPSGSVYRVWMETYMDSLVLRNGWEELIKKECVAQGDIGLFTRTDSMSFSIKIMTRGGLQKSPAPMPLTNFEKLARVVQWSEVKFYYAKGVKQSNKLVSTLYSIWVSSRHPILLFAAHMKQSAVENGTVLFARDVSAKLPAGPAKIGLVFDGSPLIYCGNIVKREDQAAKINGGWLQFVRANNIKIGYLYVYKFEICEGGWQVTLFEV